MLSRDVSNAFLDAATSAAPRRAPPVASAPTGQRPPGTRAYPCIDCPKISYELIRRGIPPTRCPECRAKHSKAQRKAYQQKYRERRKEQRSDVRPLVPSDVGTLTPPRPIAIARSVTLEDVARVVSEPGVISIAGKLAHHIHIAERSYVGDTLPEAVAATMEGEGW